MEKYAIIITYKFKGFFFPLRHFKNQTVEAHKAPQTLLAREVKFRVNYELPNAHV